MIAAPALSAADATVVLAALLTARTGQQIAANRSWRVDTALRPLMKERGIETLDELIWQVLDGRDARIGDEVVNAMLNQETSFFRDAPVFAAAAEALAASPPVPARRQRIWCAGCASGQEPYSLAMELAERRRPADLPEIVATDVSEPVLARARAGRYSQFEIQRGLPIQRMMRWFEGDGDDWVARAELRGNVSFRRHNLVQERAPAGPFDAVFCRNVLFYLSPARRADVLDAIADVLRPGGVLVLGAGETVLGQTDRFEPSRRFRGFYEPVGSDAARLAG